MSARKRSYDLRMKRAYDPPAADDGYRVLIDRLWPRGLRKENAHIDLWLKEIAPSTELRKWFNHQPELFPEFRRRYTAEVQANGEAFAKLCELAGQGTLTLVYSARDSDHNDAVVLFELLKEKLGIA